MSYNRGKVESVMRQINERMTSVGEEILCFLAKQQCGVRCVKPDVRVFVLQRLSAAAVFMCNLIKTLDTPLDVDFDMDILLHAAEVPPVHYMSFSLVQEEPQPSQHEERSPSLVKEEPQPSQLKQEPGEEADVSTLILLHRKTRCDTLPEHHRENSTGSKEKASNRYSTLSEEQREMDEGHARMQPAVVKLCRIDQCVCRSRGVKRSSPARAVSVNQEPEDHLEQQPEDHLEKEPEDHLEKEPEDHLEQQPEDHLEKEPEDHLEQEPEDHLEQQPEDHLEKEPEDHLEKEPEDHLEQEPEDHLEKQPEDHLEKEPEDHLEKEPEDHLEKELEDHLEKELEEHLEQEPEDHLEKELEEHLEQEPEDHLEQEPEDHLEKELEDHIKQEPEDHPDLNQCVEFSLQVKRSSPARTVSIDQEPDDDPDLMETYRQARAVIQLQGEMQQLKSVKAEPQMENVTPPNQTCEHLSKAGEQPEQFLRLGKQCPDIDSRQFTENDFVRLAKKSDNNAGTFGKMIFQHAISVQMYRRWVQNANWDGSRGKHELPHNLKQFILRNVARKFPGDQKANIKEVVGKVNEYLRTERTRHSTTQRLGNQCPDMDIREFTEDDLVRLATKSDNNAGTFGKLIFLHAISAQTYRSWVQNANWDGSREKLELPLNLKQFILRHVERKFPGDQKANIKGVIEKVNEYLRTERIKHSKKSTPRLLGNQCPDIDIRDFAENDLVRLARKSHNNAGIFGKMIFQHAISVQMYRRWVQNANWDGSRGKLELPQNLKQFILRHVEREYPGDQKANIKGVVDKINEYLRTERINHSKRHTLK